MKKKMMYIDHLGNSENSFHFCPIKSDGNNFQIWEKHFKMIVSARLKMSFLLGKIPESLYETHPKEYRIWKACVDTIHSW